MPTDPSTDSATATTRRTFLARATIGGALVTTGVLATPLRSLLPFAGAQGADQDLLTNDAFAVFATPLELAAVLAYESALGTGNLDADWTERAQEFQANHQAVADLLATLVRDPDAVPTADPDFRDQATTAINGASDQNGVLQALADLEDTLSATHLSAIPALRDTSTAKTVAQVLAVEGQQAALLATASGATISSVTPAEATTDNAES